MVHRTIDERLNTVFGRIRGVFKSRSNIDSLDVFKRLRIELLFWGVDVSHLSNEQLMKAHANICTVVKSTALDVDEASNLMKNLNTALST